jgi:hypothetical protein
LDPTSAGSNPAEDDGTLREIKVHSTTSFGGDIKPLLRSHKTYGKLKNPTSIKEILHKQNSVAIFHELSPVSLLHASANNCQRALVYES